MNYKLPFFTYGVFRPGEISFLGIKDYVENVEKIDIKGKLLIRDGIFLYTNGSDEVHGYLIKFKDNKSIDAYKFIDSLEPRRLLRWEIINQNNIKFNILVGVKPNKGSESIKEAPKYDSTWEDPFFNSALKVLDDIPNEDFEWNLKPLFKLQMKYMLLWTILERYTFLLYSIGGSPTSRINKLSENKHFIDSLKKYVTDERVIYSTEDPREKSTLNKENPKNSINYYYQLRSNITHRGKAVVKDYEILKKSYNELINITKYLLNETKKECDTIKAKWIKNSNYDK